MSRENAKKLREEKVYLFSMCVRGVNSPNIRCHLTLFLSFDTCLDLNRVQQRIYFLGNTSPFTQLDRFEPKRFVA